MKWNRRLPRFNHVNFFISALDRSSKVLSWVGSWFSISLAIPFSKHHFFQTDNQKEVHFVAKSKARIWLGICGVSLIADQSECLVCYFLCTGLTLFCIELTVFCTKLPENCIYFNQSELSNFFMYVTNPRNIWRAYSTKQGTNPENFVYLLT